MIDNIKNATQDLSKKNVKWRFAGFIWMHGEHEAGINQDMANDYQELLSHFIASVREDLKTPALHFLIGEVNSYNWVFGNTVRLAQKNFAKKDKYTTLIETGDFSRNGSGGTAHFDAKGMLDFGKLCASAITNKY